jgi:hypothetical protein
MRTRLLALLAAVAMALPTAAEARFGKSGGGGGGSKSSSSHSSSSGSSSSSSSSSSGNYHAAVPVGSRGGSGGGYAPYATYRESWWAPRPWYGWGFGYYPVVAGPAYYPEQTEEASPADFHLTLGISGQAVNPGQNYTGGAASFQFAMEGEHFGFSSELLSFMLPAEDGSGAVDRISLVDANLTYALVSNAHGRLRLEGGLSSAVAPDIAFFGPDFGVSGALGLLGPVSIDFSLRAVPYPFRKVDWSAGLAVPLGPFALRGGWRVTWLDDAGYVDGVQHVDTYSGPYLGLAIAL